MPEDAIFIPLGFTRQRPQTYYKGSDPEWQSFLEFRRDRDKEKAVRSKFLSRRIKELKYPNDKVEELVRLIGSHFSGMRPIQRGLGSPIKIRHCWLDVLVPEGPPPEYERSGYAKTFAPQVC